jgi:beta-N-acetylhexosaminidase
MNLRQQIGQTMIIGLKGKSLESDEKKFISENNIGGVILFGRNVEDPKQLHALVTEVQALRQQMPEKTPLFVSIDMEGGRVARLKAPFTQWPPLAKLGHIDSSTLAFKFAETMGHELTAMGINMNFAPCLDTLTNPQNVLIGDRALSSDPEAVAKLGSALVRGYLKADVIACAKHFPGHGNTVIDSHEDLPVEDGTDLATLRERELVPFKKSFRAKLDLLMTAHVQFPKVDPDWPVTLSEIFLKKILREELGYRQLVITDDLDMKALAKYHEAELIPVRALQAGADILLYCNDFSKPALCVDAVEKALKDKKLHEAELALRVSKITALKKARIKRPEPLALADVSKILGHPEHLRLAKAILSGEVPKDLST